MIVCGFLGMSTKFVECTLGVQYRDVGDDGTVYGGPMYYISKGLKERGFGLLGKISAVIFAIFCIGGSFGGGNAAQSNQAALQMVDLFGLTGGSARTIVGIIMMIVVGIIIIGGIKRIGQVASRLVPFMVALYFIAVIAILIIQIEEVPGMFQLIFTDAFSGKAAAGGALGYLIKTGIKRAAFSNEAGIGTAPMMHGTAKTNEPIREGLVAMIGPAIDTLIVCTLTALAILSTGVWKETSDNGISLTLNAFNSVLPYNLGNIILIIAMFVFAFSTLFSYSYYGVTCLGFLTKPKYGKYYNYFYVISIVIAAVVKIDFAINLIDSAFAMMAIPTIISALLLSKKVNVAAKEYFSKLK